MNLRLSTAILSIFALVVLWQNCGEIQLAPNTTPVITGPIASLDLEPSYLSAPPIEDYQLRMVFMIDMSNSMAFGNCPGSVDTFIDGVAGVDCTNPETGIDNDMYRIDMVRAWIDQVEEFYGNNSDRVKILIMPFSGGRAEYYMNNQAYFMPQTLRMRFHDMTNARSFLDQLQLLHEELLLKDEDPSYEGVYLNPDFLMGTSVPATKLQRMETFIRQEITELPNPELTKFEIFFLSDGIAKPSPEHMVKTIEYIWEVKKVSCREGGYSDWEEANFSQCRNQCSAELNTIAYSGAMSVDYSALSDVCRTCFRGLNGFSMSFNPERCQDTNFFQHSEQVWGSISDNFMPYLFSRINAIRQVFNRNSEVKYTFNFLRLENEHVADTEKLEERNWLVKAEDIYSSHRNALIVDAVPPFSVVGSLDDSLSYRLKDVFIFNANTRVNSAGVIDRDSDADGLFDFEENQISWADPQKTRTNNICLDVIRFRQNGCIETNCDPSVDIDGDGLNECEEFTLATDPEDFDTDNDGIPDGVEVVYGLSPLLNDVDLDSNGDGVSNYENFTRGLHPYAYPADVRAQDMVNSDVDFHDFQAVPNDDGQTLYMAGYTVSIHSLPTTSSLSSEDIDPIYSRLVSAPQPSDILGHRLIGGSHAENFNKLQVLAKVESVQNVGEFYWVYYSQEANFIEGAEVSPIDFGNFRRIHTIDPGAPSE